MATTTKAVAPEKTRDDATPVPKRHRKRMDHQYPYWFYLPAAVIYSVLFLLPTFASFYFSLTRWSLFETEFIGLDNFVAFFQEPALVKGLVNTLIYGVITSGLKVVLGMLLAVLLTSQIIARGYLRSVVFFPVLLSGIGVGIMFQVMMNPEGSFRPGMIHLATAPAISPTMIQLRMPIPITS